MPPKAKQVYKEKEKLVEQCPMDSSFFTHNMKRNVWLPNLILHKQKLPIKLKK
jgi:hypothetical protein